MDYLKRNAIIFTLLFLIPFPLYSQDRTIKPGDVIEITVVGHEDLSRAVTVTPEGTVDFPSLQGLPVDDISLQRFREIVVAQLSRYIEPTPLVSVRFAERYPIRVTILGQVANPGLHTVLNTTSLQGLVRIAGGFIPGAQLSKIKLIRKVGENISTTQVDMEKFYLAGDPIYLPTLKDGDTIVVPGNPLASTVKVLGSVERPGSYDVSFKTTLLDVIYLAGGPLPEANLGKIKIISLTNQDVREIQVNIKQLFEKKKFKSIPIVVPGDIVYIPKKFITWRKVINVIRDVTTFAALYYLIVRSTER